MEFFWMVCKIIIEKPIESFQSCFVNVKVRVGMNPGNLSSKSLNRKNALNKNYW